MGREVKRVPADFDWPQNEVWKGYLNPHYGKSRNCPFCEGSGESRRARELKDRWYGKIPFAPSETGSVPFEADHPSVCELARRNVERSPEYYGTDDGAEEREARRLARLFNERWSHHLSQKDVDVLAKEGRLRDLTHEWTAEGGWMKRENGESPTAQETNEWSLGGMGHDAINCWIVVRAACERENVSVECAHCSGEGILWETPEAKAESEAWEREEPPKGEYWQIWETVSEGSPISPALPSPEELARWMAGRSWGADKGTPYETWLKFIRGPGWAPSAVGDGKGSLMSGVEAMVSIADEDATPE